VTLRLRLALWYGSLTTLIVALVCGYGYAVHSRTHYDELDRLLHGVTAHVRAERAASTTVGPGVLEQQLLFGTTVRIFDREGRLLERSAGPESDPAIDVRDVGRGSGEPPYPLVGALVPTLHRPGHAPGRFGLLNDARGERTRLYVETLPDGGSIMATMPLSHLDDAVRGFGRLMVVMALAAGLLAFSVGWLVARRALHPVAIMTQTAAAIASSRHFSRRVADGPTHDELGQLAHTFNAMLASLQEAYDSQVRFVSAASHELRAPLTVIQANLDLLRTAPLPQEEREVALGEASSEADRMARLVADLLALARADTGVPIRHEAVELDRLILDVLGEARHLARGQRLQVLQVEPTLVHGDRDRLRQLFLNLVENSLKYTSVTGHVTVSIGREGTDATVVIRDDGVGIAAADLPHVFDRFFRADPARSRDPGGSGLGLSIAQWVASEHGGSLELESRLGEGTSATVRLPLAA
jgi:two-component system OmpR family sensor kinase